MDLTVIDQEGDRVEANVFGQMHQQRAVAPAAKQDDQIMRRGLPLVVCIVVAFPSI